MKGITDEDSQERAVGAVNTEERDAGSVNAAAGSFENDTGRRESNVAHAENITVTSAGMLHMSM